MTAPEDSPAAPLLRDRKIGLIVCGLLQVGLGVLCALLVALTFLIAAFSKTAVEAGGQAMDPKTLVPGMLIYVLGAVWFIWLGVGSMLARRWARALILVASWLWLVCGVSGLLVMGLVLPEMFAQMEAAGQMPPMVATMMKAFMLVFATVSYVALPGGLVLFYGSRHVKATCEARNPAPAWTDACPLPVLATSLLFGLWAVSLPTVGCFGWALPCFGFLISGPAGAAVALVTAALLAYTAWGTYRLDRRAWACAVGLVLAYAVSVGVTFTRHSLMDYYMTTNIPKEQVDLMRLIWEAHAPLFTIFCCLWFAALLGYLLYTRKHYPSERQ